MTQFPQFVTRENFTDAWKYTARKRRWSIKKELLRRITVTLAQLMYFFVFLILAFGVFYEMGGDLVHSYIEQIPKLGVWWNRFYALLFAGTESEVQRLLRCAGMLYLVPFGAMVPITLLIYLLYHPRTPKCTGDEKQDAWQLRALAKHADIYAKKKDNNTASMCSVFMGIFMAIFVLGLLLFAYTKPELHDQVLGEAHLANLRCFLYGLAMFLCYRILNIPLKLMLTGLTFCHIPASLLAETESYYDRVVKQSESVAGEHSC